MYSAARLERTRILLKRRHNIMSDRISGCQQELVAGCKARECHSVAYITQTDEAKNALE